MALLDPSRPHQRRHRPSVEVLKKMDRFFRLDCFEPFSIVLSRFGLFLNRFGLFWIVLDRFGADLDRFRTKIWSHL